MPALIGTFLTRFYLYCRWFVLPYDCLLTLCLYFCSLTYSYPILLFMLSFPNFIEYLLCAKHYWDVLASG